jgi:cell division protein FtsN
MRFEFLTPQIFNMLVIANMLVGLALIAYRFTRDMQQPIPSQHRQQAHDEASHNTLDDTDPHAAQAIENAEIPAQKKQDQA